MADSKISSLSLSTVNSADVIIVARSGSNYKLNLQAAITASIGGAVNFTSIGATTPGSGAFTTGSFSGALTTAGILGSSDIRAGALNAFYWTGGAQLFSPSDGVIKLSNSVETDFNRLQFGGTTASFPAIKRSGTVIQIKLADDSAFTTLQASSVHVYEGFEFSLNNIKVLTGSGTPEGAITAVVGSTYHRSNGGAGTSFYVKESGTGNTGWVAK